MQKNREEIFFENRASFRAWLTENHTRKEGIWAVYFKKSGGLSDLGWDEVVEECLCFGWIDSLPGKVDETRTKLYIAPRKHNSGWSRRNKGVIEVLIGRGLMAEAGIAAIERAKANGSWNRFDLAEDLVIPSELAGAFTSDFSFKAAWDALTESKQRQYLQQIHNTKSVETRIRRIEAVRLALCN